MANLGGLFFILFLKLDFIKSIRPRLYLRRGSVVLLFRISISRNRMDPKISTAIHILDKFKINGVTD